MLSSQSAHQQCDIKRRSPSVASHMCKCKRRSPSITSRMRAKMQRPRTLIRHLHPSTKTLRAAGKMSPEHVLSFCSAIVKTHVFTIRSHQLEAWGFHHHLCKLRNGAHNWLGMGLLRSCPTKKKTDAATIGFWICFSCSIVFGRFGIPSHPHSIGQKNIAR